MGVLVNALARLLPEAKANVGMAIPVGEAGTPRYPDRPGLGDYWRYALEGYSQNDLVYAAIEERATSAAEPRLAVFTQPAQGDREKVTTHPLLDLFETPNPFMDRYSFIASIVMFLDVAGNAFLHKERSAGGKVVQLWHLRPDRVRVIPDAQRHVGGYEYRLGTQAFLLAPQDVVHLKTRHPRDDYYGLPPLAVAGAWVDISNAVAAFTKAFFQNAGVPSGLLNIQRQVSAAERDLIRTQFRNEYAGPGGWHRTLVLDGGDASYTAMGLPLGERGLAMPSMDELLESHIVRPFGVPLELLGARLSMRGQRSAVREARAGFWDETLAPLYQLIAAQLQLGFTGEPVLGDGWDCLDFDLSTVKALAEDQDAKHKRVRDDMLAGVICQAEAREALGYADTPTTDAVWVLGSGITMQDDPLGEAATADPEAGDLTAPPPNPLKPPADAVPDGHTGVSGHVRRLPSALRETAATLESGAWPRRGNGQH